MKKSLFILIASLFLCGTIFAQEPEHYWTYNINDFGGSPMTTLMFVTLDDNFLGDNSIATNSYDYNFEVAAFINGTVRMSAFLFKANDAFEHLVIMSGVSLETNEQETITFKLYNHSARKEYDICDETFISENNGDIGSITGFVTLHFHSTFTKEISSYSSFNNPAGGYYLIASPIGEVDPAATEGTPRVTNLLTNSFDLYYFDQAQELEWRNYETTAFHLTAGKGYLYANNQDVTLTFIGAPYSGDGKVILEKLSGSNIEFPGWNLVGNPWAQTAYITKPFYTLDADGYDVVPVTGNNSVNAMEGIFVIAENNGEEMVFSTTAPTTQGNKLIMDLSQERGNTIDRAIVSFGNGGTLPKFQLHQNNTKLYIPQNNEDYAIVNSGNDANLPVCFKAAQRGVYTLTLTADQVDMNYLHLIDNKTGIDQDMLSNPRYSFDADVNDDPNRFILQFHATITDVEESFNPITFRHDGNLTVNGVEGGELSVIDMLGRVVSNETFSGDIVRHIDNTPGVYVVRLTTEGKTYTQKIVVE